jgi:hypothetical protein
MAIAEKCSLVLALRFEIFQGEYSIYFETDPFCFRFVSTSYVPSNVLRYS